jgi:subtilisin family serine protease
MLDTGYYQDHPALEDIPVVAEWDFINDDGETQNEPGDDTSQHDHGTITWSILGGYAPGELIGVAYGASFALAKTEDITSETPAEEDNYVAALEWMDSLGVDLASGSLSYRWFDDPGNDYEWEDLDGNTATTTIAVDLAASRGMLVVISAGNYGPEPGSLGTPADADSGLSVGGTDEENGLIWFSSRGPTYDGRTKPEVLARGVDVYHAFPGPPYYSYSAGTSVAAPLVAGCAALIMEARPDWSAMDIRSALMWTADRARRPDSDWGWGRVNVLDAIYRPTHPHISGVLE